MANRFLSNIKINDAYTFPASDGTNGQVITTDGAGNLTFQDASASGATLIYKDTFTGDSTTVEFTMAQITDNEVKAQVYFDGVYQSKNNYSINGAVIAFDTAPPSGTAIEVITFATLTAGEDFNQKLSFYGKATEAITKGDAVMFAGVEGDHFLISKAVPATINQFPEYMLGLAAQNLNINDFGYVTQFGRLNAMNTTAYTSGDILWFASGGAVNGALTTIEPTAPNAKVQMAAVVRSHIEEGVIFVRPDIMHRLGDNNDVNISSVADKDMLVWDAVDSRWENTKTLGNITTGNITTSGTVDGVDVSLFKSDYDTHNHDSRYYTETEIDTFLTNKTNWDTAYGWGDHSIIGYLTSFTETDPIYTASSWYSTTNNSGNWDTAYSWGDHASAGYLTSFTETDPIYTASSWYTTTNNSSNWNTAYGWGNHASAGYITGYTETDTLSSVTSRGNTTDGSINVRGNILLTGDVTTANQGRMIDFTGFDKEGVTDFSDRAYIQHTVNAGGHAGSVLVISSENDANDGIAFLTNASSALKHNGNDIITSATIGSQSVNYSASSGSVAWGNVSSKPGNIMYYQGFTLDANTMDPNSTGFTYSVNAPYTGPIARFSTGGGYDLWLNSPYAGNGYGLAFRTRNGDAGSLNSWQYPAVYGVNANSGGSLYSTIYYDQNNTDYYLDPNGTSNINLLNIGNAREDFPLLSMGASGRYSLGVGGAFTRLSAHPSGNGVQFGTWDGSTFSAKLTVYNGGASEATDSFRAPIFYDSNDTRHYLNLASSGLSANFNGNIEVYARSAAWAEGLRVRVPTTNTWGGIRWTRDRANYDGNWALGFKGAGDTSDDLVFWANNAGAEADKARLDKAGNLTVTTGVYSPIFYDSNDTSRYIDPNGTSAILSARIIGGELRFHNSSYYNGLNYWGSRFYSQDDGNGVPLYVQVQWVDGWRTSIKIASGIDDSNPSLRTFGRTQLATDEGNVSIGGTSSSYKLHVNGTAYASSDMRAPLFYDSNDTGYYLDPANSSTSLKINGGIITTASSGSILLEHQVSEANAWIFKENATNWGLYWFNAGSVSGQGIGSYTTVGAELFGMNNAVTGFNPPETWTGINTDTRAAWMLSNYSGYFWSQGTQYSETDMRAPLFYDANNTGYYVDATSTSNIANLHLDGYIHVSRSNTTGNGIILADDGDIVDLNDAYCSMRFSYGVRVFSANRGGSAVHTLHSNGTFTASGDVVAYSDARVKENIEPITNALEKTLSLKGVYYNRTDKEDKSRKVGVIAQEIIEVLPEVVTEDDQGMLGVSYGNITAVLIEAIKELSKKVEELENKLNGNN